MGQKTNEIVRKARSAMMGPETMHCRCNVCSKTYHIEEAKYCTRCGTELDLDKAISKTAQYLH